jgi:hypothetical protein
MCWPDWEYSLLAIPLNSANRTFFYCRYKSVTCCTLRDLTSLIKQQFVVTESATLPDTWLTNTPSVRILNPHKTSSSSYVFAKNITCLNVGLLTTCQVFFLRPAKLHQWVTAICWFIRHMVLSLYFLRCRIKTFLKNSCDYYWDKWKKKCAPSRKYRHFNCAEFEVKLRREYL